MQQDILDIDLTEQDFELILNGLKHLPSSNMMGDFMIDIMLGSMIKDEDKRAEMERERNIKKLEKEKKVREMEEDIDILKSKIILLKRYFSTRGVLKDI